MSPVLRQLMRYALVGSTAVGIWFAMLAFSIEALNMPRLWATTLGLIVASLFNYLMQHIWVFETTRLHRHAAPTYAAVTLGGLVLNALLFAFAQWVLSAMTWLPAPLQRVDYLAAQAFSTGIVFLYNFWANRRFTFQVEEAGDLREAAADLVNSPAGDAVSRVVRTALTFLRVR